MKLNFLMKLAAFIPIFKMSEMVSHGGDSHGESTGASGGRNTLSRGENTVCSLNKCAVGLPKSTVI